MSEVILSLLALSPLSLLSHSFAPYGLFGRENVSGVNQNRHLLRLIDEFWIRKAIGRIVTGNVFVICKSPFDKRKATDGLTFLDDE